MIVKDLDISQRFTFSKISHPRLDRVWIRKEYCKSKKKYRVVNLFNSCHLSNKMIAKATKYVKGSKDIYIDFTL